MNFRKLGNSELEISEISFGCMSLKSNVKDTKNIIHLAIDKGINYFDTADLYEQGRNEELLGKALKDCREKVIIGTKVGNQLRQDGKGWDWNPSKKHILKSIDESLRRLQTDYIDLYQLHGGTLDDPIDETIEAFEMLKKSGKIRSYGISSIRPNVIRTYAKQSNVASVMLQYSLLDRRPEESSLKLLQENNIGVLTRGTIAKGLLAGKPIKEYLSHTFSDVQNAVEKLKEVSKEDRSLAQTAIQFVLKNPAVSSTVIGFRTKEQLQECIHISETLSLSKDELEELQNNIKAFLYENHR